MKIGVYGGTFNPPHIGHINSAAETQRQLGLDMLFIIPTAIPPHKNIPENSPSPEMRLEMARLAFEHIPNTFISDIEINRGGKSYTSDTVSEIISRFPEAEILLIMGEDMFFSLEDWYNSEWILKNTSLAVFSRTGQNKKINLLAQRLSKKYGVVIHFIKTKPIDISSTNLRQLLEERSGGEYFNAGVYNYIIKNRLYGAKPDFDWLRQKALSKHEKNRIPHVLGTEYEAVKLAERWGCDVDEARTAAILHDITKKLDINEQLILCENYGTMTDVVEKKSEKLLHAKTGALIAYHEFGVSDNVYNAIYWHTTGKEDMSLLEKIIYLADYIEPTRSFPGLAKLRKLAYSDLNEALKHGFEMSLKDMENRGITPHPKTREALEFLYSKEGN